jgi:ABC-type oligopeptide transport system substrate-binding subunit
MHEGTAEHISGLKVIDDHTLEVTLESRYPISF